MASTSTPRAPLWSLVLLPILALVILSPIIGLLFAGLALTVGIAAVAIKFGVLAVVVWAVVMPLKELFGSHRAEVPPSQMTVDVTATVEVEPKAAEVEHGAAEPDEHEAEPGGAFVEEAASNHASPN